MARKKKSTGTAPITKAQKALHHSVQNTGFMGRLAEFLTYKAEQGGKSVLGLASSVPRKPAVSAESLSLASAMKELLSAIVETESTVM